MELRHLRYFVAVAEELHFTRAAERLHIGQPPLSMQIRDLEDELGVALFERNRRRVRLTDAGERFLIRARALLADAAAAVEEARRCARGELGLLRIGFTSSLAYSPVLPEVLEAYRRAYPAVELQLNESFTDEQLLALSQGRQDVGLVRQVREPLPAGLRIWEIGRDPLRLVVPASHPLAGRSAVDLQDLANEGFITFPPGVGTGLPGMLKRLCHRAGFEPRIVQVAREASTQIGLVAAGLGLALLPAPLEYMRIPRVRYLPVTDPEACFTLSVAIRNEDPRPLLQGFLDVLARVTV